MTLKVPPEFGDLYASVLSLYCCVAEPRGNFWVSFRWTSFCVSFFHFVPMPPKAFGENAVHATPPSIHAYGDVAAFVATDSVDVESARVRVLPLSVAGFRAAKDPVRHTCEKRP